MTILQTIDTQQRPISVDVAWPPTISFVTVLLRALSLQTVTDRKDYNGPLNINIGLHQQWKTIIFTDFDM